MVIGFWSTQDEYGYKASDGKMFKSSHECIEYERALDPNCKNIDIKWITIFDGYEDRKIAVAKIHSKEEFISLLIKLKATWHFYRDIKAVVISCYDESFIDRWIGLTYDDTGDMEIIDCELIEDIYNELRGTRTDISASICHLEKLLNG